MARSHQPAGRHAPGTDTADKPWSGSAHDPLWNKKGKLHAHASAGNRTRVTSMATMYSATRPLMLLLEMNLFTRRCTDPAFVQMHSSVAARPQASFKDHEFVQGTASSPEDLKGTWCSGITPAQHAGGPGFNPQRVHGCLPDSISQQSTRPVSGSAVRFWKECISRESNPGHIDGNDVFCH